MGRFDAPTNKPFAEALSELVRENDEYLTQTGNINWHAFAQQLDGVHYETLRKALAGQRNVTPHLIEEVSRVLRVKPEHFVEWRLAEQQRQFDVREVGFEQALSNLERWAAARAEARNASARSSRRR